MLSLDTGGRGLVLGVPGFVDSPQEALPFLWSEWRVGEGERRRGREEKLWLVCRINKKFKKDFQRVLLNTKMIKYNSHSRLIFK